jgi:hypothetical protein
MIPVQFLALAAGTTLIMMLHAVRRRLSWEKYFIFSDFLVEERHVTTRGFVYMALPPLVVGFAMGLVPIIHPLTITAAGFLAAFLAVWPVFQFPDYLLDEYLLPYWGKLKFLYVLFTAFSTTLSYAGFLLARTALPLVRDIGATNAWHQFLDSFAANAIYDLVKWAGISLLLASGLYISGQRKRIGAEVEKKKEEELEAGSGPKNTDII